MTPADIKAEPLAVWDANDTDGLFWRNWEEATPWAIRHFPDRARRIHWAEFYLLDTPFAILHYYAENDHRRRARRGHLYLDRRLYLGADPCAPARADAEPVVQLLDELPPAHLMGR